jgi:transcription termination factor Rho
MNSPQNHKNDNNTERNFGSYQPQSGNAPYQPTTNGNGGGSDYFSGETVPVSGVLEVLPDYGVLRQDERVDENLPKDVYISQSQIKRFALRMGDLITGQARPPKREGICRF